MRSATLDSNFYISAFEFGGIGVRLFELAHHGLIRIDISDEIINETLGVLRDKFNWDGYRIHHARDKMLRIANRVVPATALHVIKEARTTTAFWNAPAKPRRTASSARTKTCCASETLKASQS